MSSGGAAVSGGVTPLTTQLCCSDLSDPCSIQPKCEPSVYKYAGTQPHTPHCMGVRTNMTQACRTNKLQGRQIIHDSEITRHLRRTPGMLDQQRLENMVRQRGKRGSAVSAPDHTQTSLICPLLSLPSHLSTSLPTTLPVSSWTGAKHALPLSPPAEQSCGLGRHQHTR